MDEFRRGGCAEFRVQLGEGSDVGGRGMQIGKKAVCTCAHRSGEAPQRNKGN